MPIQTLSAIQVDKIRKLEKHIRIAAALDYEATVGGNGINAYEAMPVLDEFLSILNLNEVEPSEDEIAEAEETSEY